jgi:hypothetical protein
MEIFAARQVLAMTALGRWQTFRPILLNVCYGAYSGHSALIFPKLQAECPLFPKADVQIIEI